MKTLIKNGRVINPKTSFDEIADVVIAEGKVIAVGSIPDGFNAEQTIDATGQYVFPGIIDLSARLREPGFDYKATIASETQAAASAGITTLCCPPDTAPVIDSPAVVEMINHLAEQSGKARVVIIGALSKQLEGSQISEMSALKTAGVVGVGNGLRQIKNTLVMRRALEYASSHNLTVFLFSEDPWLRGNGSAHEGAISTRMGLEGVPEIAEVIAVARDLALIEQTGVRAHFCQLSTAKAKTKIARAQSEGLPVTVDVSAHQLHLTDMDIGDFDPMYHVRPPLRSIRDRDVLRQGIKENSVSVICSDHQPHDEDAKDGPFSVTEPGISGIDTLLPLTMRLVADGVLTLQEALASLTYKPAEILGLNLGTIELGATADLVVYDPNAFWTLTPETMQSAGKNSPFLGWEFDGKVTHTFLEGRLVYSHT